MNSTSDRSTGWLADAVIYQIYPQSFADADGDGVGELRGIEERLDYLSWLGVDVVWLNPVFASPFQDAGYDVADHRTIAARYGTVDDLVSLVEAAARLGVRILLDLIAGHTSDQHRLFVAAADDPSGSWHTGASGTAALRSGTWGSGRAAAGSERQQGGHCRGWKIASLGVFYTAFGA
jgi:maltose alpha-D-glucosyltransferase/alpha-amylase